MSTNGETDKKSVAARLVGMAQERYILGVSDDGEPFGADRTRPHLAMFLRGGRAGLRADLAARYFAETGAVAGGQALTDSTLILEGHAASQRPERLYLRIAEHEGMAYVDTGRTDGQIIRIGGGRWTMTDAAPVRFLRTKLTGGMPLPAPDGDLARLWDFVNVSAEDRPVLLAVLVAALVQCDVPHPVLALFAEQGSAKSTTTRMLVDLIDPSPVPLRQAPRDADSWVIAASGSWVVALDNVSAIPPWLSDSLCRAATGDGSVKRALYTDADLAVLKFRRCVIVNGIDVGAVRPDLAERLATVELRRIDRQRRQAEATLRHEWQQALPGILGGLLSLAAVVHQRLETISLDAPPRMADFGRTLAAVDEALAADGLRRYLSRADQLSEDSLSADPFIERLRTSTLEPIIGKSAGELLAMTTPAGDQWRRPKDWPKNGRDITAILRRHAPALRSLGWTIDDDGARNHRNVLLWTISPPQEDSMMKENSQPSRSSWLCSTSTLPEATHVSVLYSGNPHGPECAAEAS
ncbi:ATP-binding protein [Mycobacterium montefiorense]|uniref:ATP-binding protein n=1 Tax=Mycobacterium montefiorense TaxID=154654 RepID=A0AA37PR68_9MYCO|nr:ATP-binding protein [Mycobacterium montefiorense]GBG39361.1 ATP-binding protein [Mycobacterium montefiorense]GKU37903.1 ATP-binding protein [Mycobacterium montefiorense]GKU42297.1 ATP-binding protein [Mycobacterium montefiorense]GKU44229.1 ATP-binding protein [Mycobacterium montefiorense]GKU53222.1 ATP-binding protein [Mycobacterium montefiorense]